VLSWPVKILRTYGFLTTSNSVVAFRGCIAGQLEFRHEPQLAVNQYGLPSVSYKTGSDSSADSREEMVIYCGRFALWRTCERSAVSVRVETSVLTVSHSRAKAPLQTHRVLTALLNVGHDGDEDQTDATRYQRYYPLLRDLPSPNPGSHTAQAAALPCVSISAYDVIGVGDRLNR
jgi:hypothetical protein